MNYPLISWIIHLFHQPFTYSLIQTFIQSFNCLSIYYFNHLINPLIQLSLFVHLLIQSLIQFVIHSSPFHYPLQILTLDLFYSPSPPNPHPKSILPNLPILPILSTLFLYLLPPASNPITPLISTFILYPVSFFCSTSYLYI
jgi:hypothetical protein